MACAARAHAPRIQPGCAVPARRPLTVEHSPLARHDRHRGVHEHDSVEQRRHEDETARSKCCHVRREGHAGNALLSNTHALRELTPARSLSQSSWKKRSPNSSARPIKITRRVSATDQRSTVCEHNNTHRSHAHEHARTVEPGVAPCAQQLALDDDRQLLADASHVGVAEVEWLTARLGQAVACKLSRVAGMKRARRVPVRVNSCV